MDAVLHKTHRRGTLADFRKQDSGSHSVTGSQGAADRMRKPSLTSQFTVRSRGRRLSLMTDAAFSHPQPRRSAPELSTRLHTGRKRRSRPPSSRCVSRTPSQETISEVDKEKIRRQFRLRAQVLMALMQLFHRAKQLLRQEPAYREQIKTLDALAPESDQDKSFLMFDPDDFKACRQMRVTEQARKLLKLEPEKRSPQNIYYLTIALRGIKQLAEYPLQMQNKLANYGFFESFDAGRMIVRQGTSPEAFYFVLYGTVLVAVTDEATRKTETKCFLHRGDNFGELSIINNSSRQSTVISQTYVELLSIDVMTYQKIFMVGGVKEIHDPDHQQFIRDLTFLRNWPLEMLGQDPKKLLFCYFKRGAVLVKDSNYSDWIYVVKSGSLRVLMVLEDVKSTINPRNGRELPAKPKCSFPTNINHRDFFTSARDDNVTHSSKRNVGWTEHYVQEESTDETTNVNSCRTKRVQSAHTMSGERGRSRSARLRTVTLRDCCSAGPIRDRTSVIVNGDHEQQDDVNDVAASRPTSYRRKNKKTEVVAEVKNEEKVFVEERRTVLDDLDSAYRNRKTKRILKNPVCVHVQTLTKGEAFGLTAIVFDEQPSLSLVSNGAECILINKSLYLLHCPKGFLPKLRNKISPYPPESQFQKDLLTSVNWNTFRHVMLEEAIRYNNGPCWP